MKLTKPIAKEFIKAHQELIKFYKNNLDMSRCPLCRIIMKRLDENTFAAELCGHCTYPNVCATFSAPVIRSYSATLRKYYPDKVRMHTAFIRAYNKYIDDKYTEKQLRAQFKRIVTKFSKIK